MNSPQILLAAGGRRMMFTPYRSWARIPVSRSTVKPRNLPCRMFDRSGWAMPICAAAFGLGQSIGCHAATNLLDQLCIDPVVRGKVQLCIVKDAAIINSCASYGPLRSTEMASTKFIHAEALTARRFLRRTREGGNLGRYSALPTGASLGSDCFPNNSRTCGACPTLNSFAGATCACSGLSAPLREHLPSARLEGNLGRNDGFVSNPST